MCNYYLLAFLAVYSNHNMTHIYKLSHAYAYRFISNPRCVCLPASVLIPHETKYANCSLIALDLEAVFLIGSYRESLLRFMSLMLQLN